MDGISWSLIGFYPVSVGLAGVSWVLILLGFTIFWVSLELISFLPKFTGFFLEGGLLDFTEFYCVLLSYWV